jgi:hypothetical protein
MSINMINPYQGMQNPYRPCGGKTANAGSGTVVSAGQSSGGISSGETDPVPGQSPGIAASIGNLRGSLENLNVVHDPPFFPIATYQRVDIILQINHIQAQIGRSSLAPEVKQAVSTVNLKKDATDKELGAAIGRLFAVHNTLTKGSKISVKNTNPGSILTLKA